MRLGQSLQPVGIVGHERVRPADDHEPRGRQAGTGERCGLDEVLDPLLGIQAADPADQHRVLAAVKLGPEPRPAGGIEFGRSTIDGISTA